MKTFTTILLGIYLLFTAATGQAVEERMMMARIQQDFPEAMAQLQKTIGEYGYTVSRIQHIDVGLTASGFQTDRYRIVFFGKPEEIRQLSTRYPRLIPYLPLMITIFSEGEDTLISATDPMILRSVSSDQALEHQLLRWRGDIAAIMDELVR